MFKKYFKNLSFFLFFCTISNFSFSLDESDVFLDSVFFTAVKKSNYDKTKEMLAKGVSVNAKDSDGLVALAYALKNDDVKMFNLLIENGAEINTSILKGTSLLIFYVTDYRYLLIKNILDVGAKINFQDKLGRTALMHAIEKRNSDAVRILFEQEFDKTLTDFSGKDIFDYSKAARNNYIKNLITETESH